MIINNFSNVNISHNLKILDTDCEKHIKNKEINLIIGMIKECNIRSFDKLLDYCIDEFVELISEKRMISYPTMFETVISNPELFKGVIANLNKEL